MPVAEMPAQPHQMLRIGAANFDQRLGRRHHFDQASVFQHKRVTAAQGDGVFEIEQEDKSARAGHRHAPPMAIVVAEHHRVGGRVDQRATSGRAWPGSSRVSQRFDLAVRNDLDDRRCFLQRRGERAPRLHVRRATVRVEVFAGFPTLDHDEGVGVVDAGVAVVSDAAFFLLRGGDAVLRARDISLAESGFTLVVATT